VELVTSRLILQSCRIAYFITDRDLSILELGGAVDALCGDHDAALGRSLTDLVPEFIGSESSLSDLLAGRRSQFQLELINRSTPEGDTCYITLTVLPYEGQRTDAAMLIVASDASREASYAQMLNQTRDELRLTCQMRDDLLHTLVHDLCNPLAAIALSLQLLEAKIIDKLSPDLRRTLANARNSTFVMSDLVNNILDMNRLESGQMPLQRESVSLADLVARVLRMQSLLASYKDIRLESDVPPALPDVWADVGLIERVLQNLLRNAIRFTLPGGWVRVTAGWSDGDRDGIASQQAWLSVADSGLSISPELQDRLFQKFAVGQPTERGSDIGLAFCKLAVEAHGGRITADSEPGQGTAFTFTLPIASPDAALLDGEGSALDV
jgi:signal transduction histidine kinase